MKNNRISITELSKIKGITTETLRHYDRIGLLKAKLVDPKTNYRYYSCSQCEEIGTILELRNLGMSLPEIKEYMENRDLKRSYQLLTEKENELKKEIREKKRLLKTIQEKLEYIDKINHPVEVNEAQVRHLKKRLVVTLGEYTEGRDPYLFNVMNLEQYLKDTAPLFASDLVCGMISKDSFFDPKRARFSRMPYLPVEKCKRHINNIYEIPEGDYLCGLGHGSFQYNCDAYRYIRDWLKKEEYEIIGDIIEINIIDISITSIEKERCFLYQVPIRTLSESSGQS
ncbi:MerR family transcriptional regulator [Spirochaeta cellobiosiphila]|uniref:MerR family transcriptional regulator n=1 Tax=Spirochaeta cellobiosiphila TaxID=504483 RepID=UPI0003F7E90D|nr:helix-turn-helix domain-containing protein [Spirochaeta cellobiosiphila]